METTENDYTDIVRRIRSLHSVTASPAFRRKVTGEMIPSLPATLPWVALSALSFRMAVAGILLAVLGGTGIVLAAEQSHPNDLLYPVKKAVENIQLRLLHNPVDRSFRHLDNAEKRIDELKDTITKSDTGENDVKNITKDYESQVKDAVREAGKVSSEKTDLNKKVHQQLEDQSKKLEQIQETAPSLAVPVIQKAIDSAKTEQKTLDGPENKPEMRISLPPR